MFLSFLFGTLFGATLFFMARIANYRLETILERLSEPRTSSGKPIIIYPEGTNKTDAVVTEHTLDDDLKEALKG